MFYLGQHFQEETREMHRKINDGTCMPITARIRSARYQVNDAQKYETGQDMSETLTK